MKSDSLIVSIILNDREADDSASGHLVEFAGVVVYYYVVWAIQ